MSEEPVVYVIDDDASVRESLRNLMRSVGLKIETFGSAQEFLSSRRPDIPSCLILDVRLPGVGGLELQRQLADAGVHVPIIFITGHGDIQMSVRAMKAGAIEFLTKPFRDQDLLDVVQDAIERERAAQAARGEVAAIRERYDTLSPREKDVLGLVVRGLLNKQIAGEIGTTEATVKLHRGNMMRKMGAGSVADVIKMAQSLETGTNPRNR